MIQAGDAEVVVAGGMESMTNAPYLLPKARGRLPHGQRRGRRLADPRRPVVRVRRRAHGRGHRAATCGSFGGITREAQDELAAKSHERAADAMKEGRFADEIAAGRDPAAQGRPGRGRHEDEGVRPGTTDRVARRAAARVREGRHDHRGQRLADLRRRAPRVIVMSREKAEELGVTPIAELVELRHGRRSRPVAAHAAVACDQARARADRRARSPTSTCSSSTRRSPRSGSRRCSDLGITDDIVNVNGGAIALGHPVGMSGARVVHHDHQRAAPPRRWPRCGRPLRRWRPGRRRHRAHALIQRSTATV